MNRIRFSSGQMISVFVLFLMSSVLVLGAERSVGQDQWAAVLLSALMSLPLYLIYGRLSSKFPDLTLFEMFTTIFGNALGRIVGILYVLYAISLCSTVARSYSEFIQVVSMPHMSQFFTLFILFALVFFALRRDVFVLGRFAKFMAPVMLGLILLTVGLSVSEMNFDYLFPILDTPLSDLVSSAWVNAAYPLLDGVLFLGLLPMLFTKKRRFSSYLLGLAVATGVMLVIVLTNTLMLSPSVSEKLLFPFYSSISIVRMSDFLSRTEVFVSATFFVTGFVRTAVCVYVSAKGLSHIFGTARYQVYLLPLLLLCMAQAGILYDTNLEVYAYIHVYRYVMFPVQVVLPLVLWIVAEIRFRKCEEIRNK